MTKEEMARDLVDRVAASLDPRIHSSNKLGLAIAHELTRVAPGDKELLNHVVQYMMLKAAQNGCGTDDANHDCSLHGGH